MSYKLKPGQHAIEVVDGPFAGRKYLPDQAYAEVPPEEEHRFERTDKAPVVQIKRGGRVLPARGIEDETA
jgi:hypothetical protein